MLHCGVPSGDNFGEMIINGMNPMQSSYVLIDFYGVLIYQTNVTHVLPMHRC